VNRIGVDDVGSAWPAALLIVTVGGVLSTGGMLNVTTLSVLVEASLPLPPPSAATSAAIVAITVPDELIPDTETVYVVPEPLTDAVVAPALPASVTSPVANPVTGSENTTVNRIGEVEVGS